MTSERNRKGGDELSAGQIVLGRYRVERLLDEGGMASIYLAADLRTQQPVAIKCLYKIYANNDVVRARFIDEGRIQMMLQHPNIVRVYQFMEQPTLAFVMEFVQGQTLEELLLDRGVMEMHEILEIMVPVLSALGLAHSRHIVHRDLKPSNILLTRTRSAWHPKVMDFGVAKLKRTKNLTATGTTVGTLHYMSPEQIVGSKKIDGRADIYSLGITLYKLCTGDVPFNASTEFALMMAQVESPPAPPCSINPRLSQEFEAVVLKALEKKPANRFQNIKEFTSALLDLRDAHGHRTRDTIDVPEALIEYAMRADRVAVDRTDEIMISSRDLDLSANDDARTLERDRPEAIRQLAESLSAYAPIGADDEQVDATIRIDHGDAGLGQGDEEDGAATIELESLKLDSSTLVAARRGRQGELELPAEEDLQTMDMALDITTRSKLATDTLAQLMRESEQRQHAVTSSPAALTPAQGEEDRTTPMRVKTDEIAALARSSNASSPPPNSPGSQPARRVPSGSNPRLSAPTGGAERPNPFSRSPSGEVKAPARDSAPHASPFNRPPPSSPLAAEPEYAHHVVGAEGVDTSERTVPFKVQRSDPSIPVTITAERFPDQHPAWQASVMHQASDGGELSPREPHAPAGGSEEGATFFDRHGRTVLLGVLLFFASVCVVLVILILK